MTCVILLLQIVIQISVHSKAEVLIYAFPEPVGFNPYFNLITFPVSVHLNGLSITKGFVTKVSTFSRIPVYAVFAGSFYSASSVLQNGG
jgi:hypothetical protein